MIRLVGHPGSVERAYLKRTGVVPIMHLVVIGGDVYRADRWIAADLLTAFSVAKDRAVARALDDNAARSPIPWADSHAREMAEPLGGDPWPYGIGANRTTLSRHFSRCAPSRGSADDGLSRRRCACPRFTRRSRLNIDTRGEVHDSP